MKKALEKFSMIDSKPVSLSITNHFKLSSEKSSQTDEEFDMMRKIPYTNPVGSIMYLMICFRPDFGHGIGILNRFITNLGETRWIPIKGC